MLGKTIVNNGAIKMTTEPHPSPERVEAAAIAIHKVWHDDVPDEFTESWEDTFPPNKDMFRKYATAALIAADAIKPTEIEAMALGFAQGFEDAKRKMMELNYNPSGAVSKPPVPEGVMSAEAFAQKTSDYYCMFIIPQILARQTTTEDYLEADGSEILGLIEQYTAQILASRPVVPDGWKLVPIEPTDVMANKGANYNSITGDTAKSVLRAGIAAAPQPPQQTASDGWMPIETAPVGVNVLLFCPERGITNNERIELDMADNGNGSYHPWATRWMPMPAAPEQGDAG